MAQTAQLLEDQVVLRLQGLDHTGKSLSEVAPDVAPLAGSGSRAGPGSPERPYPKADLQRNVVK